MVPGYALPQEAGYYSSFWHQRSLPARTGAIPGGAVTLEKQTSSSWALAAASTDCSGSNASDVGVDADTMHLQSVWDVLPSSDDEEDEPILRNDARAVRAQYAGNKVDTSAIPPTMMAPNWLTSVPPPPQQPPSGLASRAIQAPPANGSQLPWVNAVSGRPNHPPHPVANLPAHPPVLASAPPSGMGVVPYGPMKSAGAAPSPPSCAPPDLPHAGVPQPPKAPPQVGVPAGMDEALPRAPQWQYMDPRQAAQGAWMMPPAQQAVQLQQQMMPHGLMSQQQQPPQLAVPPSHPPPPEPPATQRPRHQKSQGKSTQPHVRTGHFEQQVEEDDGSDCRQSSGNQQAEKFRCEFVKTRLCRFELMGCCQKGTSCPFAHGAQDLRTYPDLTKTSICHKWARGCCPLPADRCRYAHGTSDRRLPEFTSRTSQHASNAGGIAPAHHS